MLDIPMFGSSRMYYYFFRGSHVSRGLRNTAHSYTRIDKNINQALATDFPYISKHKGSGFCISTARDFQAFQRIVPHSEYPSASTCLCLYTRRSMRNTRVPGPSQSMYGQHCSSRPRGRLVAGVLGYVRSSSLPPQR